MTASISENPNDVVAIGLFVYVPGTSLQPDVLMQLTCFYSDGTLFIVDNSIIDSDSGLAYMRIIPMDGVVHGGSSMSISKSCIELPKNVDVSEFSGYLQTLDSAADSSMLDD